MTEWLRRLIARSLRRLMTEWLRRLIAGSLRRLTTEWLRRLMAKRRNDRIAERLTGVG